MLRKTLLFHSTLSPSSAPDTLLRSIDRELALRSMMPWFIRVAWRDDCRKICGAVEGNTFRLKKCYAQWSPTFYGRWEAEYGGTRIEGYFGLAPLVRWSLLVTLIAVLALAVLGIVLNTLDLQAGTHFTVDPQVGFWISVAFVPFVFALYFLAQLIGSRRNQRILDFLEQTLAASCIH